MEAIAQTSTFALCSKSRLGVHGTVGVCAPRVLRWGGVGVERAERGGWGEATVAVRLGVFGELLVRCEGGE